MPATRRTDPDTSHEAERSVRNITITHLRIMTLLMERSDTHHGLYRRWMAEVNDAIPWPPISESGLRTRVSELVDIGYVKDSGVRLLLPSGRKGIVWQLTSSGRDEWWLS